MKDVKFFDSIHGPNRAINFIEKYLYLDGLSDCFGSRKFSVYTKKKASYEYHIKENPEKRLSAKALILTILKISSYLLSFFILPLIVIVAKAIYRSNNTFKVITDKSEKNDIVEKAAYKAIGLPSSSNLLDFYRGKGRDVNRRSLQQLWDLSMEKKESCHDYIQWLFPLEKPSQFNVNAPLLDRDSIASMRQDPLVMANIKRSLTEMLTFYGLRQQNHAIERADNFFQRSQIWLTPNNHNHLRLTRILHSLTLLGLRQEANALLGCLEELAKEYPNAIDEKTVTFWRRACLVA